MTEDPRFPRDYKRMHGAPHDPDPGPWPYLIVVAVGVIAALAILITTYI